MNEPHNAPELNAFVFPGSLYLYRSTKIFCRFQVSFRDPVEPDCLQAALDSVMERADYFKMRLVVDRKAVSLVPNDAPCRIIAGSRQPNCPEETDGYLFAVSYQGSTVYFDWYHFLTDGYGAGNFVTQLAQEYCNRRYGTAFVCTGQELVSSPLYDVAELTALAEANRTPNDLRQPVTQTSEGRLRRTLLRVDKDDWVRQAQALGVKPFVLLLGILCQAMGQQTGEDTVSCTYSINTRAVVDAPNAMYNCVASFRHELPFCPADTAQELASALQPLVAESLAPEQLRLRMAEQWGWVHAVSQLKGALRIKQRVFEMGEYAGGIPSDFWLSYLGDLLYTEQRALSSYLTDYQVWVPPEGASMGIEEVTLNGRLMLCIQDKLERPGLAEVLRRCFEANGIRVYAAETLHDEGLLQNDRPITHTF